MPAMQVWLFREAPEEFKTLFTERPHPFFEESDGEWLILVPAGYADLLLYPWDFSSSGKEEISLSDRRKVIALYH